MRLVQQVVKRNLRHIVSQFRRARQILTLPRFYREFLQVTYFVPDLRTARSCEAWTPGSRFPSLLQDFRPSRLAFSPLIECSRVDLQNVRPSSLPDSTG